jgi:hypothetical protein
MTADIIPLATDRPSRDEAIARVLSKGTVKPSPARVLQGKIFREELFDLGWEIVPRGERRE